MLPSFVIVAHGLDIDSVVIKDKGSIVIFVILGSQPWRAVVGTALPDVLRDGLDVPEEQIAPAMSIIEQALATPLVQAAMPIQDAVDLAEFLVNLSIGYSRFSPGAPIVGGPVEIAAITKHEDFKWVRRKHYFNDKLNPRSE